MSRTASASPIPFRRGTSTIVSKLRESLPPELQRLLKQKRYLLPEVIASKLCQDRDLRADLIQEGYIALHEAFSRFSVKTDINKPSFFYLYVRGRMLDFLKREEKHSSFIVSNSTFVEDENEGYATALAVPPSEYALEWLVSGQLVRSAIAKLTEKARIVLQLHSEGYSNIDIAKQCGVSPARTSTLLKKSIKKLQISLL